MAAEPQITYGGLGELADHAAQRFGDRILWQSIDDGSTLTFAQFAAQTTAFAIALRGVGVERGTHVAVMLPNVAAFAVTWFALARLGAVIVPVNTQYTSRELAYVLRDSDATFLVIDESCEQALGEIDDAASLVPPARTIVHRASPAGEGLDWRRMAEEASTRAVIPMAPAGPDALMSIQYTSGSTGFPKGCLLTQDYWLVLGGVRAMQGPPPRRILLDKPLSYMGGMWRLLVALYVGATACVARRFTLSGLQQRIVDHDIDFFSVTDPVAKLPGHPGMEGRRFAWISTSGLSKGLHVDIERKFRAPVRELYGMTETGSTLFMPIEDDAMSGSGSCGRPAPFRECRIVGADGLDVPAGTAGELWVRGRGLLIGYYNKEEATRQAFAGDWFRTGDLFRQDAAGYFYIVGRIKDSIRRSGENISTREVESVVASVPGVMEAAALGVPDEFRGEEVKVFVILQPGITRGELPPEKLIAHCESQLAAFKLPRYIEYVDEFPRTSSGKIAKQEMKQRQGGGAKGAAFDRVLKEWT